MVHSTVLYILHAKATTLRDEFKGKVKGEERHRKQPGMKSRYSDILEGRSGFE